MGTDYLELLTKAYDESSVRDWGCPPESRLEFLGNAFFSFTTYDGEMDALFARKAVEVCHALNERKVSKYIEDKENYRWYLLLCNTDFFDGRLEWGTSIRGAWWDPRELELGCSAFNGHCGYEERRFATDEWKRLMQAVVEFAAPEMQA